MDCLFCKIIAGEIPAKIRYRDEYVVAFDDISPQAPQHQLIIPIKHIPTVNDIGSEDNELIGRMIQAAGMMAKQAGIAEDGYRLVMNCNKDGGQVVFHLHLHMLGGREMTWPPG